MLTQACREGEKIEDFLFIRNFKAAKGGGSIASGGRKTSTVMSTKAPIRKNLGSLDSVDRGETSAEGEVEIVVEFRSRM